MGYHTHCNESDQVLTEELTLSSTPSSIISVVTLCNLSAGQGICWLLLPAAPIGLERRTVASGSRDQLNLQTQQTACISSHLISKKDIFEWEKVLKTATKMSQGVEQLSYEERLKRMELLSLEKRQLKGDLIQVYNIMNGVQKVNKTCNLPLPIIQELGAIQCNSYAVGYCCCCCFKKYFFTQCTVNLWNLLPWDIVKTKSITDFKKYR
ncbi:hypothetical protein UY3_07165 [Chelonia mydas]|uniref:Uncharacterized protein n=1 Tax=Chelonia mydas TaxID=8469 RepID=M7BER9_CHEMY|nr:hypothetical protein UY3_07165 [Chelonia mydas]